MADPLIIASIEKNRRGERVRVALQDWRDNRLLDLRITAPLASHADQQVPTAKGLAIQASLIPQLRAALADAEEKAREIGWLDA